MTIPNNVLYTREHIWLKIEGDRVKIGLTEYAQSGIGEILLVELPEAGKQIKTGERFAVIETAKAITDLKSPVSGLIIDVNKNLEKEPDLINKEPFELGWLVIIQKDPSQVLSHLMDFEAYGLFLEEEGAK